MSRQQPIQPNNQIEQEFLQKTPLYNQMQGVTINQLSMATANEDMMIGIVQEEVWPTKQVRKKTVVQHALPGREELQKDTVITIERVPLSLEEMQGFQVARAKAMVKGKDLTVEAFLKKKEQAEKKAAKATAKGNKPATAKKNTSKKSTAKKG